MMRTSSHEGLYLYLHAGTETRVSVFRPQIASDKVGVLRSKNEPVSPLGLLLSDFFKRYDTLEHRMETNWTSPSIRRKCGSLV